MDKKNILLSNTVPNDALGPSAARSSATMVLANGYAG